ncbi:hypothetical protein GCM10010233_14770 [Streptomyces pseudogriseolus]|uniref:Secreted protein n=1 Tax=Streptomyces pseudogriseolus TaxID=36817 RepID=A0ABQ2SF56_STREZ|nr:hypothetical protein GCM10010233_14770 [Streptomyces gancidicus]GGS26732.1 hypothetical protein GCM10010285_00570 [Streptomyces rubiginosus]
MPVSSASCARAWRSTSMGFGFFRAGVLPAVSLSCSVSLSVSVRLRGAVRLRGVRELRVSWLSRES